MIIKTDRVYRRTEAGLRALGSEKSVPIWYRRILGLMDGETPSDAVLGNMYPYASRQTLDWLDELETLGFTELVAFTSSPSPDTTGNFSMLSMRAQQRAA
ncbi:MAG TPA: hypothetical protein VET51_02995 [Burkholderiales bacterium]|nr:hypothetical protein [Burkholderiales bacterium]